MRLVSMSKPYLAAGIVAALIITSISAWYLWRETQDYQMVHAQQLKEISSYDAETANRQMSICLEHSPFGSVAFLTCLAENSGANREAQKSKYDLAAQQEMAEWGFAMLLVSAFSLVISVFGLVALFVSLDQTRTAVRDTREIGEAQTAGYVALKRTEFRLAGADHGLKVYSAILDCQWRNAGHTAVTEFGIDFRLLATKGRERVFDETVRANAPRGPVEIGPADETNTYATIDGDKLLACADDIQNGLVKFRLFATGSYRTIFGRIIPLRYEMESEKIHAGRQKDGKPDFQISMARVSSG
ncbi:hypothetical protein NKH24_06950 [Mesorhizobium sp. M1300]|uniref:hypothetical protein n=1 Tax=Mesorhizobium sp. M1300 TaxID=2957077 RepID=UPI003336198B